jgi:hypothetical protein
VEDKQDRASICSTQFFLGLVDDIKKEIKATSKTNALIIARMSDWAFLPLTSRK